MKIISIALLSNKCIELNMQQRKYSFVQLWNKYFKPLPMVL
jgi:hypothetical protein